MPVAQSNGRVVEVLELGRKNGLGVAPVAAQVVRAAIVSDQHGAVQLVRGDQEVNLIAQQAMVQETGATVAREPGRPAGDGEAVVVRKLQVIVQELIDVVAVPAVAAVDRHRMDALGLERIGAPEKRRFPDRSGRVVGRQFGLPRLLFLILLLFGLHPAVGGAKSARRIPPLEVTLFSAAPSGIPVNDRIWVSFYPAVQPARQPAPAVVLLHPLADTDMKLMRRFARYLAARGIGCALMELPYHGRRRPPGERSGGRFTDPSIDDLVQAARQSASDVSTVVSWLCRQPSVDPHRVGVVGVSLGAIVAHLAMGEDGRLSAGVAILGGGNLADLRQSSIIFKLGTERPAFRLSPEEAERLRSVDPIQYARQNRPRRVLMVQAARDLLVPPRDAKALWEALGRPPIRWVDTNHFGLALMPRSVMRLSAAYLHAVWDNPSDQDPPLPPLHAITLKMGFLTGLDSEITPALQWQALTLVHRWDHMSLLHADLGWSGRGPFIGLAATVSAYIDLGIAHRFTGGSVRPYLSFHVVF
jgi:dienelactone hydrolase